MLQFLGQDSYFEYSVPQDQPSKQYITTHHNVRQGIAKTGYNIEREIKWNLFLYSTYLEQCHSNVISKQNGD